MEEEIEDDALATLLDSSFDRSRIDKTVFAAAATAGRPGGWSETTLEAEDVLLSLPDCAKAWMVAWSAEEAFARLPWTFFFDSSEDMSREGST